MVLKQPTLKENVEIMELALYGYRTVTDTHAIKWFLTAFETLNLLTYLLCTCKLWPFSGTLGLAEAQCCVFSLLVVADEDAELANGCRHYLALARPVMKCLHDRLHEAASHI